MTENEKNQDTQADESPEESTVPAATETSEETDAIPYTLKDTSEEEGSVKRFTVEVEREIFDAKLNEVFQDLRKTVAIDGFRTGKAPVGLLRKRFGKEAEKDALNEMAQKVAEGLVKESGIEAVGDPILHDSTVEAGQPVTLVIDYEYRPEIDVQDYEGGEYEVAVQKVSEDLVDQQLQQIRDSNTTFEEPEDKDKAFEKGDAVTVDMVVTDAEGNRMESLCRDDAFLRDPFEQLMPEVAEALVGAKAGDTVTQEVSRTVKNREGEEVTHTDTYLMDIKDIKVKVVPELDDEFAKDVGEFETLEDLKNRIRDDLKNQAEQDKRQKAVDKIFDHLIEKNQFEAPRSIVAGQQYQSVMRDQQYLQQMGVSFEALGMNQETYLENAKKNAEHFVKINLLVNALGKKAELEVTDEDVDKEIERRAEEEGRKPLAIRARLESEKQLDNLKRELFINKVEDFLIEKNNIKEVEPKRQEEEKKED
ncbi:MAG: trigger factor [Candidatus Sumerlaeia bacterium]